MQTNIANIKAVNGGVHRCVETILYKYEPIFNQLFQVATCCYFLSFSTDANVISLWLMAILSMVLNS